MSSFMPSYVRSAWMLLSLFLLAIPSPADAWVASDQRPFPDGEATVVVDRFCAGSSCDTIAPRVWTAAIQDAMSQGLL